MTLVVSVIGAGKIGREIIEFVQSSPGHTLGRILTRSGVPDTGDAAEFFATPCDIIIDAAGPQALRSHAGLVLAHADLWTVGAAALADDGLRAQLAETGQRHGHHLRLFSPWISGISSGEPDASARLHVQAQRPGIGSPWSGAIREGVARFPNDLNSAVAAALCGPGLDATTVALRDSGAGGAHRIDASYMNATGTFTSSVEFNDLALRSHPTATAIIRALRASDQFLRYG
ncbi:MAG: hypothetical protein WBO55_06285 [Rhizobiaceae bacterium]